MKIKYLLRSVILLVIGLAVSCGQPQASDEDSEETTDIEITQTDDPSENDFLYILPSPLQIASIFRRSGLIYIPNLTNDPNNVSNYNTKFIQKLNFGVYAADLAYSALNEQNQASIDYVKSLSSLSESLWMTNVFSSVSILQRFENNMGNADSLGYIIADFQMELDSYLEENGLSTNSLVIFSGAWIESLHLAFKSLEDKSNNQLLGRLIEQKKIGQNLIEILSKEEKDADLDALIAYLKKINKHFDSYDLSKITDEADLTKLRMSKEQISLLITDIDDARSFIING